MDGSKALMIKANDKDVVAITISVMKSLNDPGLEKMWMEFGQGGNYQLIPVHEVVNTIGPEKASGLPFFHAFTWCDTVCFLWQRKQVCTSTSTSLYFALAVLDYNVSINTKSTYLTIKGENGKHGMSVKRSQKVCDRSGR